MCRNLSSQDKTANNEGRSLLEVCKSSNLFMLNGQCGKDKGVGSFTFKNVSVIDYSILSAQLLKFVSDFEVVVLDTLYTDGHSLLYIILNFRNVLKLPKRKLTKKKSSRPKWKEVKKADFIINLDSQTISDIKASIDQARQNTDAVNQNTIDKVCIQITDLFSISVPKSFNHSESFVETMESPNHKRWFGSQCKSARRK